MTAGALTGCATTTPDPWTDIDIPSEAVESPLPCDELPRPEILDEIGEARVDALRTCARANYDIAMEHKAQIEDLREGSLHLAEAGAHQRRIADMRLEMLEDERQHHFWSSIGYWVLIVGLGAAAAQ